jgi:hypothetical protein
MDGRSFPARFARELQQSSQSSRSPHAALEARGGGSSGIEACEVHRA